MLFFVFNILPYVKELLQRERGFIPIKENVQDKLYR